jgi:hypothetical protein
MFSIGKKNKKGIAAFFLLLVIIQSFYPAAAFALTSGPVQPEMQKFQPAGTGNMVDVFSGDFKYDIPLMDVGGYPVNLSYHSGTGMEDEASWVGMGWTLNPGTVNRSMRGIPDDFNGKTSGGGDVADVIRTIQLKKNFRKIGGEVVVKPSAFSWEIGSASLHVGVYKDNYYGIGGEMGASLNFNVDKNSATTLTAGLGLSSDTRSGVTVSPSFSLSGNYDDCKELNNGALTGGFSYNTRSGLEEVNLGQSFSVNGSTSDDFGNQSGAGGVSFGVAAFQKTFAHTYTPTFGSNTRSTKATFSFDLGPALFGGYFGLGGSGYVYNETNAEPTSELPAFGYLNYAAGMHNTNAILDFNREKDGPFITNAPAIPIPVSTEDYFTATCQTGSAQYRPFYNGEYTVFDRTYTNNSSSVGLGVTVGAGNAFQGGARIDISGANAFTRRWDNAYTRAADPNPPAPLGPSGKMPEAVYFKKTGELTAMDNLYYNSMFASNTQKVSLGGNQLSSGPITGATFVSNGGQQGVGAIQRQQRDVRTSSFSYLTAREASVYGLDKQINGQFLRVDPIAGDPVGTVHKAHHISEITVTDETGKRMLYGIPVYNTDQEEVSFSVAKPSNPLNPADGTPFNTARKSGLVSYTPGLENSGNNNKGRLNIYNRKTIPPYATSYLLTGILSPDYVDRKGDGITDDDLGTAIKFGYQRWTTGYNWRAPYEQNMASYNEGFLSDDKDDKGNYVFGRKELWYMQTIESKTMVAQCYTSQREDALGVIDENGGENTSQRVLKLDSIRLFSKADLAKNGAQAVPIKVAHFVYDYSLYPGEPNNSHNAVTGPDPVAPFDPNATPASIDLNAAHGKLTLRKVYFTFGTNGRGQTNPYIFNYDLRLISSMTGLPAQAQTQQDPNERNDSYTQRQTDRWGTYKQSYYNRLVNGSGTMNNSEFPYSLQPSSDEIIDTRQLADRLASKWQLNSVTTPSGGIISVEYESDDYSYVQDRQAAEMYSLVGIGSVGQATGLINATKLYVKVPVAPVNWLDFANTYLRGPNGQNYNQIAFKVFTDMDGRGHSDYVYGYAEIEPNQAVEINGNIVGITVKMVNGYNPISKAAWQTLQADLPQLAYDNYDNSDVDGLGGDIAAAVRSIVQAFINFRELGQSFDQMASSKSFGNKVDLTKSMIRLNAPIGKTNGGATAAHPTYGKLGGGLRVRKLELSDNWQKMAGSGNKTIAYGIQYDYTRADEAGNIVSSGVAAYEPGIGNEENPFHEPVNYTEKVQWSQDRYHYIEKPFGESYFPAPDVGYSSVKATSYGADYSNPGAPVLYSNTGYTISQFYTARDFPTQVDYLPLDQRNYENDLTLFLFASKFEDKVSTSQGFKVVLNDMHGKSRAISTYDKNNQLLNSTTYNYSLVDDNAQQKQLNNVVPTLAPDGTIQAAGSLIGTDEEIVTDIRESNSNSSGTSIGAYAGLFWAFWPVPYAAVNYNSTASVRAYNSISTIKVIRQYGLLKQTRTMQSGSLINTDNLLWDGQTGEVLLTRSQNEFNDYTYALNLPAYMAYDGMGNAAENIGTLFAGLTTSNSSGTLLNGLDAYLAPGDELVDVDAGMNIRGWVIPRPSGGYNLVDQMGNFITTGGNYRLVRSGRRNMLSASGGTVVTMTNPMVLIGSSYVLQTGVDKKVLDAKAATYKDEWDMPVPKFVTYQTPIENDGCLPFTSSGGKNPAFNSTDLSGFASVLFLANSASNRRYVYSFAEDNVSLADLLNTGAANGFLNFGAGGLTSFFQSCGDNCHLPDLSTIKYYLTVKRPHPFFPNRYIVLPGDQAYIASATQIYGIITFDAFPATSYLQVLNSTYPSQCPGLSYVPCSGGSSSVAVSYGLTTCTSGQTPNITIRWNSIPYPYSTGVVNTICNDPLNNVLNPYYQGVKGNWRADYDHVYQVNRSQPAGLQWQKGGTNIRQSGSFSGFTPFWSLNGRTMTSLPEVPGPVQHTLSDPRWEWTGKPIHFDQKGNEIENLDPFKKYGSALYGYLQSAPTAVAVNARHNEIAFDGFEDYYFQLKAPNAMDQPDPCPSRRHLDMGLPLTAAGGQICGSGNCIVTSPVHSGNYSLQLSTLNISQPGGNPDPPSNVLGFDGIGRYILLSNEQEAGFAPVPGKKYLLSVWVYDNAASSNKVNGLQVSINGSNIDLSNLVVPVVEGWKKLDIPFTAASNFTMQLSGAGLYIDDLRLLPFDAQMKTYVYDDKTMWMKGQLDENNFGMFFEYDDEGTPVRMKKETERGIMTVKENRQSFRKYTQSN